MVSALFIFLLPVHAIENATITGDGLRIREKPTTGAAILGSVNKGTRVEVLAHTDKTDSIDGFTGYWYLISHKKLVGYVFGKYINIDIGTFIPTEGELQPPKPGPQAELAQLEDILGDWPMYYDAPNITFSFYPDGSAKFVESTIVGEAGERVVTYPPVWGTYTFDGRTIEAQWNDGTNSVFVVEKYRGVTTISINGVVLPPELHLLGPGESLMYD
jgi:hypothetical protein